MIGSFIQGGLGNQLFQVAAGVAHAKRVGSSFAVIEGQHYLPLQGNNISTYKNNIMRGVESKPQADFGQCVIYNEQGHQYTPLPLKNNIFLMGYFQSEKYFEDYKDDISELFSVPPQIQSTIDKQYPFLKNEKVVSLHVRRGDYLQNSGIHPTVSLEYYYNALDSINDKDRVLVFSDDIAWCKNILSKSLFMKFKQIVYSFSEFSEDYMDLYTMSNCYHHILANSTFSWWGAWLSKYIFQTEGRVFAPKTWFGPESNLEPKDILPDRWEKL
jgi:hypothetical protein